MRTISKRFTGVFEIQRIQLIIISKVNQSSVDTVLNVYRNMFESKQEIQLEEKVGFNVKLGLSKD